MTAPAAASPVRERARSAGRGRHMRERGPALRSIRPRKVLDLLRRVSEVLETVVEPEIAAWNVLVAFTAGEGLGFNRAFLLLSEGDQLRGWFGVGPRNRRRRARSGARCACGVLPPTGSPTPTRRRSRRSSAATLRHSSPSRTRSCAAAARGGAGSTTAAPGIPTHASALGHGARLARARRRAADGQRPPMGRRPRRQLRDPLPHLSRNVGGRRNPGPLSPRRPRADAAPAPLPGGEAAAHGGRTRHGAPRDRRGRSPTTSTTCSRSRAGWPGS